MDPAGETAEVKAHIEQIEEKERDLLNAGNQLYAGQLSGELASMYNTLKNKAVKKTLKEYAYMQEVMHQKNANLLTMFPDEHANSQQRAATPPLMLPAKGPPGAPKKPVRPPTGGGKHRSKTNKRKASRRCRRRAATRHRRRN